MRPLFHHAPIRPSLPFPSPKCSYMHPPLLQTSPVAKSAGMPARPRGWLPRRGRQRPWWGPPKKRIPRHGRTSARNEAFVPSRSVLIHRHPTVCAHHRWPIKRKLRCSSQYNSSVSEPLWGVYNLVTRRRCDRTTVKCLSGCKIGYNRSRYGTSPASDHAISPSHPPPQAHGDASASVGGCPPGSFAPPRTSRR